MDEGVVDEHKVSFFYPDSNFHSDSGTLGFVNT